MKLNFTLRENVNAFSSSDELTVIHKLKSPIIINSLDAETRSHMERLWLTSRKSNFKTFESKILEYFEQDECFGLLVPPTKRDQFTTPLKEFILEQFTNVQDLSSYFSKEDGVSFGTSPYSEMTIAELSQHIQKNEEINITNLTRILIIDDVYSQGKTFDVMEYILTKENKKIEFISGTLIRTK